MKYVFASLLLLHGLIHLMGFAKAFHFAEISQLTQPIGKPAGAAWGITAVLFTIAGVLFLMGKDVWWLWAAVAAIASQILIFTRWQYAKFGTFANTIALAAVALSVGESRYFAIYKNDAKAELQRTVNISEPILTEADLLPLPLPVQRYLRYLGVVGKPKVVNFRIDFEGKIRKDEQSAWMPFASEQYNFMDSATRLFFMKASMKGLPVAGYHRFKNGDAFMDIRLLSMFKVQYQSGREMGIAETVTFFNDMCRLAPATLIDKRIQWLETDGDRVKAAFTNNGITITAWLYFNEAGQLINFISEDRYAAGEGGTMEQFPWSTPLKDYKTVDGHRIAMLLPFTATRKATSRMVLLRRKGWFIIVGRDGPISAKQ